MFDRLVQRLRDTFASLQHVVTNDRLVRVTFSAGNTDVQVRHGLDGPPVSWEVVDRDTDANLWRSDTLETRRDVIILRSSAPTTVTIRFI